MKVINYNDHPSNTLYKVFDFLREDMANHFEKSIEHKNIPYEKHVDDEEVPVKYLYGIHNDYFKEALQCNFLTYAKYRAPMISIPILKYALVGFVLLVILFAVFSYYKTSMLPLYEPVKNLF